MIDHLRAEGGLRNQFLEQVRNVLLAFGRKGLLVARAAAEGGNNNLLPEPLLPAANRIHRPRRNRVQRPACSCKRGRPQQVAPCDRFFTGDFV